LLLNTFAPGLIQAVSA